MRARWTRGENRLYFAVDGEILGRRIVAREDWDGSVQVTVDGDESARFRPGGMLTATELQSAAPAAESDLFGLLVLLPFAYRIHRDESELIESLLEE